MAAQMVSHCCALFGVLPSSTLSALSSSTQCAPAKSCWSLWLLQGRIEADKTWMLKEERLHCVFQVKGRQMRAGSTLLSSLPMSIGHDLIGHVILWLLSQASQGVMWNCPDICAAAFLYSAQKLLASRSLRLNQIWCRLIDTCAWSSLCFLTAGAQCAWSLDSQAGFSFLLYRVCTNKQE